MIRYSDEEGLIKTNSIRDENDKRKKEVKLPKTAFPHLHLN